MTSILGERREGRLTPQRLKRKVWWSGARLLSGFVVVGACTLLHPTSADAQASALTQAAAPALAFDRAGQPGHLRPLVRAHLG